MENQREVMMGKNGIFKSFVEFFRLVFIDLFVIWVYNSRGNSIRVYNLTEL
jgi:hypothetical protein